MEKEFEQCGVAGSICKEQASEARIFRGGPDKGAIKERDIQHLLYGAATSPSFP